MGRKYAIGDQQAIYFVTFTVVECIDVFIRPIYNEILIEGLKYCQKAKGLRIHAFCIMTSHIHLILSAKDPNKLSDIIRDYKSFTSSSLRKAIFKNSQESRKEWIQEKLKQAGTQNKRNKQYQFWQQHNHPIMLDTNDIIDQRLEYLHQNPVKSGFVLEAKDWFWSSARQYFGE